MHHEIPCFDIGGTEIKAAVCAPEGHLRTLPPRPTPRDDIEAFAAVLVGALEAGGTPPDAPVAIAIAGVVDPASGRLTCANIPCVDGLPLAADLERRIRRRCVIGNDADCFALAQALQGAGRGRRIVFGAVLGTGVGGGLVIDGRLVRGAGGYAGEWGHGPITALEAGTPPLCLPRFPCGCGLSGCLDTVGAARGIERLHAHIHGTARDSRAIVAAWRDGDPPAVRTVDVWTDLVAGPLALVVNTIGADIVPVGGGLGGVGPLMERLDQAVRARILRRGHDPLVVSGAGLTEPGLRGAALLALGSAP